MMVFTKKVGLTFFIFLSSNLLTGRGEYGEPEFRSNKRSDFELNLQKYFEIWPHFCHKIGRLKRLFQTACLEFILVELGGVEPPSEITLPSVLHV